MSEMYAMFPGRQYVRICITEEHLRDGWPAFLVAERALRGLSVKWCHYQHRAVSDIHETTFEIR